MLVTNCVFHLEHNSCTYKLTFGRIVFCVPRSEIPCPSFVLRLYNWSRSNFFVIRSLGFGCPVFKNLFFVVFVLSQFAVRSVVPVVLCDSFPSV